MLKLDTRTLIGKKEEDVERGVFPEDRIAHAKVLTGMGNVRLYVRVGE